jgi:hypothetical protein
MPPQTSLSRLAAQIRRQALLQRLHRLRLIVGTVLFGLLGLGILNG